MFHELMNELRATTRASRTTLRLDQPDAVFPVVAEALDEGVRSIADQTEIDLRSAPTVIHLAREGEILVQNDLDTAQPRAPQELIEFYGVRAQMLAPILVAGELVGINSVHDCRGPRSWTTEHVKHLEAAQGAVQQRLAHERNS
jgi:maleate isomerase